MSCEFAPGNGDIDGRGATCKTTYALMKVRDGLGGAYTIKELKELLCDVSDSSAHTECSAYNDLSLHGRASAYCQ